MPYVEVSHGHSDKELNEQWKKDLLERIEWKKENPNDW